MWRTKSIAIYIYTIISLITFINAATSIMSVQASDNITAKALLMFIVILNAFACVIMGFAAWDTTKILAQQKQPDPKKELPKIMEHFQPTSSELGNQHEA